MLNVAMVLMILAGICGLPAAACSTACAGLMAGVASDPHTKSGDAAGLVAFGGVFMGLAVIASIGSIVTGALVRKIGKIPAGITALVLALIFAALLLQANPLGIPSALMLVVAAIMIFVAPRPEYTGISKVEITK